jgi:branched-chain amino acid transport system substrate-binding protein
VGNATEGAVDGRFVLSKRPAAKIAVLATNDDAGQSYVRGLKGVIAGSKAKITTVQTYEFTETTMDSQVAKMRSSGADTVLVITLAKYAGLGLKRMHDIGWKPMTVLSYSSSSRQATLKPVGFANVQGVYSAFFAKDPSDPQWAGDPAVGRYRNVLARYGHNLDPDNPFSPIAYANAQVLVQTLRNSKELTRDAVNEAAHNLTLPTVDGLLPGIPVTTGPDDPWPIESLQLVQFRGDHWARLGGTISYEGKTPL